MKFGRPFKQSLKHLVSPRLRRLWRVTIHHYLTWANMRSWKVSWSLPQFHSMIWLVLFFRSVSLFPKSLPSPPLGSSRLQNFCSLNLTACGAFISLFPVLIQSDFRSNQFRRELMASWWHLYKHASQLLRAPLYATILDILMQLWMTKAIQSGSMYLLLALWSEFLRYITFSLNLT